MLIDVIKARVLAALKAGRTVEKEVLRVALGEMQTIEARGTPLTDEDAAKVVVKLVKSNRETMEVSTNDAQKAELAEEIAILETLLPKALGVEELALALAASRDAIRAAGNDGQATGIAMKALKAAGIAADGKKVGEAVKQMRA
ncbi:MAG TPA: GatB/YqeY domain-containing protein [Polyangiaceae bacterium]|jgi:hypothetical protein|nr:GatB/YqeY domain-containing protein [Polyangiaceae bacterium]